MIRPRWPNFGWSLRIALTTLCACEGAVLHDIPEFEPATTSCAPNGGPQELTVSLTAGGVHLAWQSTATNAAGFIVYRNAAQAGWTEIDTIADPDLRSYDDTGEPARDSIYVYRVTAFVTDGGKPCESLPSNDAEVVTRPRTPTATATTDSETGITIAWSDTNTLHVGYRLERSPAGADTFIELSASLSSTDTLYVDSGLTADTQYDYRLTALGVSGDSDVAQASGWTLPAAPSSVTATATATTQIRVQWTHPNTNQIGFRVERRVVGGSFTPLGGSITASPYLDTGLQAETEYEYRVTVVNPGGDSASATGGTWTLPRAPANVVATAFAADRIDIDWGDTNTAEQGYRLERSLGGADTWTTLATLAANVVDFSDDSVAADTAYDYRVFAFNQGGDSPVSNVANAQSLLPAVQGLTATSVDQVTIRLDWLDPNGNETGFRLERRVAGTPTFVEVSSGIGPDVITLDDGNLTSDTHYEYLLYAINAGGDSGSSAADAWTRPRPVSGLGGTSVSTSRIDLTWGDSNSNETGYRVERSPSGQDTWTVLAAVLPADSEAYTDTGGALAADTAYDYRVTVINPGGDSTANTTVAWTRPAAPTDASVTSLSATSLGLSWSDPNANTASFRIERRMAGPNPFSPLVDSLTSLVHTDTDSLLPDTQYEYRIYAANAGGDSAPVQVSGWTRPAAVQSLTALPVDTTTVDLSWSESNSSETAFTVERRPEGGASWTVLTDTLPPNSGTYRDTTCTADTSYDYRVTVTNPGGDSTAEIATGILTYPAPVTGLTATSLTTTSIQLDWSESNTHETQFTIRHSFYQSGSWSTVETLGPDTVSYVDNSAFMVADSHYEFEVFVTNATGDSTATTVDGWTRPNPPLLQSLSLPDATNSPTTVEIQWFDANANETGFRIERDVFGQGSFTEVATAGPTASTASVQDTAADNTRYAYRVYAINPGGDSVYAEGLIWTSVFQPSIFAVTKACSSYAELGWTDTNSNETGYDLDGNILPADSTAAVLSCSASASYDWSLTATGSSGQTNPSTLAYDSPAPPAMSWGATPTLVADGTAGACVLTIPTVYSQDGDASFVSATATVARLGSGSPTASATEVTDSLVSFDLEPFSTSWSTLSACEDDQTLLRDLRLDFAAGSDTMTSPALPTLTVGEDADEGRQVWFTANEPSGSGGLCYACLGSRGSISAGYNHACVVTSVGTVTCWGNNAWGQLGDGTTSARTNPVDVCVRGSSWDDVDERCEDGGGSPVTPLSNIVSVSAAYASTCALTTSGTITCWGLNSYGQLGDGNGAGTQLNPVDVCDLGSSWDDTDGRCENSGGSPTGPLTGMVSVSTEYYNACGVTDAGTVKCWGRGSSGAIGDGVNGIDRFNPVDVCVAGSAWDDVDARCENGGTPVAPLGNVRSVVVGTSHNCALISDGTVNCWGSGSSGQLGDGQSSTFRVNPVDVCLPGSSWDTVDRRCENGSGNAVAPLGGIESLSAGNDTTCAVRSTGEVKCWGSGHITLNFLTLVDGGALGHGVGSMKEANPVDVCPRGSGWDGVDKRCESGGAPVAPFGGVVSVTVGRYHTCALMNDGSLTCWGTKGAHLGIGVTDAYQLNPVDVCPLGSTWSDIDDACVDGTGGVVAAVGGAVAVSASDDYTVALSSSGTVLVWGSNLENQLGDGTTDERANPVNACVPGSLWSTNACDDGGTSVAPYGEAARRGCGDLEATP